MRETIEALSEAEDGDLRFGPGDEAVAVNQLAFEHVEEAPAHGIVERIACDFGGGADTCRTGAMAERSGTCAGYPCDYMHDVPRFGICHRHVERFKYRPHLQVKAEHPGYNPTRPNSKDDSEKEEPRGQGMDVLPVTQR